MYRLVPDHSLEWTGPGLDRGLACFIGTNPTFWRLCFRSGGQRIAGRAADIRRVRPAGCEQGLECSFVRQLANAKSIEGRSRIGIVSVPGEGNMPRTRRVIADSQSQVFVDARILEPVQIGAP